MDPQLVDHPGWLALAGLIGFAGNELVAIYRIRTGRRIGSAALVADGLHARTDGLSSLAVVGAAVGTVADWTYADPLIGPAISAAILNVLRHAARDIYRRLMDHTDPVLVDRVEHQLRHIDGIHGIDRVRVRWVGHQLHVDADVILDTHLDLTRAHDILENARHRLFHTIPRLADALLHASPTSETGTPTPPPATTSPPASRGLVGDHGVARFDGPRCRRRRPGGRCPDTPPVSRSHRTRGRAALRHRPHRRRDRTARRPAGRRPTATTLPTIER